MGSGLHSGTHRRFVLLVPDRLSEVPASLCSERLRRQDHTTPSRDRARTLRCSGATSVAMLACCVVVPPCVASVCPTLQRIWPALAACSYIVALAGSLLSLHTRHSMARINSLLPGFGRPIFRLESGLANPWVFRVPSGSRFWPHDAIVDS